MWELGLLFSMYALSVYFSSPLKFGVLNEMGSIPIMFYAKHFLFYPRANCQGVSASRVR